MQALLAILGGSKPATLQAAADMAQRILTTTNSAAVAAPLKAAASKLSAALLDAAGDARPSLAQTITAIEAFAADAGFNLGWMPNRAASPSPKIDDARWRFVQAVKSKSPFALNHIADPIAHARAVIAAAKGNPTLSAGERAAVETLKASLDRPAGVASEPINFAASYATAADSALLAKWSAMPAGPARSDFASKHFHALLRAASCADQVSAQTTKADRAPALTRIAKGKSDAALLAEYEGIADPKKKTDFGATHYTALHRAAQNARR